jgi:hypothetical protein
MRHNSPLIMVRRMDIMPVICQINHGEYQHVLDVYFENGTMTEKVKNWNGIHDSTEDLRQHMMVR